MKKVLIVDDEVPIRQWLEFCIGKMAGYDVVGSARNGEEGYLLFQKTLPDVVIADIRMPVMDGLEMLGLIYEINPAVYTIVLTSHEDFEYARRAMKLGVSEYILKTEITEESLYQALQKGERIKGRDVSKDKMFDSKKEQLYEEMSSRNHFLRSLILKSQAGILTDAVLKEYEIPLEKSEFVALDVMSKQEALSRIFVPENELLLHTMKVPVDTVHTMIIGNINRKNFSGRKNQMEELHRYCGKILEQIPCKIGCSDIYDKLGRLGDAMRQAYDRVRLSFYYPRDNCFSTQNTGKYQLTNGEKYKILFNRELVNQNFRNALQWKNQMMAEVRKEEIAEIEYVKKLYLFFLTSLYHMTKEDVKKIEEQLKEISQEVKAAETLDELDCIMNREFEANAPGRFSDEEYSSPVRNALRYMKEHYAESLTLPDVAFQVGLSPEYLSRLFKEETGIKFVVYLNNLKLKHALRLLETTNLKVYEIAEQVGYSNLSYFSTVFKKNFGQNPFEYKNRFQNPKSNDSQIPRCK